MRITCPKCQSKYSIEQNSIPPDFKSGNIKCKQCMHSIPVKIKPPSSDIHFPKTKILHKIESQQGNIKTKEASEGTYAYEIDNLFFSYQIDNDQKDMFKLEIEKIRIPYQAVTSILGMSGHGKTTLLSLLGFLRKPKEGKMTIYIRSLKEKYDFEKVWQSEDTVTSLRKRFLGFALQRGELAPFLNVGQNISMPLRLNQAGIDQTKGRIDALLKIFFSDEEEGERERMGFKMPHDLSGGQYQRAALARALANDPDILLADEPTGTLDIRNSKKVMEHLKEVAYEHGKCVVLVTHNVSLAHRYSDIIYIVGSGKILKQYNRDNFPSVSGLEDEIDSQFGSIT